MAEALTRHLCGDRWAAASAGLSPLGWVAPETMAALAEEGVSAAGLRSKGLEEFDLAEYGLLVNLTGQSLEGRRFADYRGRLLHRPAPDPYGGNLSGYRRSREVIKQIIIQELCRGEEIGDSSF